MTNLYLIRHGQAVINVEPIVDGPKGDTGLTRLGVQQAERLRDRLRATGEIKAEVLIASTLPRAAQTAQIIAPALGVPITWDAEVQELRPDPEADGMTMEQAISKYGKPDLRRNPFDHYFPGGENWGQFMLRVGTALERITSEHAGKTIVLVAHGGVIDGSIVCFSGLQTLRFPPVAFYTRNTSITHWNLRTFGEAEKPVWTLMSYNDNLHVRDINTAERINWSALSTRPEQDDRPAAPLPTEDDRASSEA